MPLAYHPSPGEIVICDYSSGFKPPEMIKIRPVVVISPRRRGGGVVAVVPISSSPPQPAEAWHYQLPSGAYPPARGPVWVKGDMVAAVALDRLDRVKVAGPRGTTWQTFRLGPAELVAVRAAVKAALGLT